MAIAKASQPPEGESIMTYEAIYNAVVVGAWRLGCPKTRNEYYEHTRKPRDRFSKEIWYVVSEGEQNADDTAGETGETYSSDEWYRVAVVSMGMLLCDGDYTEDALEWFQGHGVEW
jgi:hypothetical protein